MAERKKRFIQKAIKKPGALHREMGVPEGEKIPKSKLRAAAKKGNTKLAKRARLALTLEKMPHRGRKSTSSRSKASSTRSRSSTSRGRSTSSRSRSRSSNKSR